MSRRLPREKAVFVEALEITDPEQRRRLQNHSEPAKISAKIFSNNFGERSLALSH